MTSAFSTLCFITSFRLMPLSEAYALTFSAPLFMSFFAGILLKEHLTLRRIIAILLGACGIFLVYQPDVEDHLFGSAIAVLGGILLGMSQIFVRKLGQKDSITLIVSSLTVAMCILSGPFVLLKTWDYAFETWLLLSVVGCLGATAQIVMSRAFTLAEVSFLAPFDYAALLWALLFDYILWQTFPKGWVFGGMGCILCAGFIMISKGPKKS